MSWAIPTRRNAPGSPTLVVAFMRNAGLRRNSAMMLGLLMFVVAWFVPIHRHGKTLPGALPGWDAFLVAVSPLWQKANPWHWYDSALSVGSALTNLLMVALPFAWARRREHFLQLVGLACIASLGLNAQWLLSGSGSDLRVGYFLWWLSFGVVGIACLLPSLGREVRRRSDADREEL